MIMSVPYDGSTAAPPAKNTSNYDKSRSCKDCIHKKVCEARRAIFRSFKQFDMEFGDFIDISVIHNAENSVIDNLAISCKEYVSYKTEKTDGR